MLIVKIPSNNVAERRYAIKMVFDNFLGVNYQIEEGQYDTTIVAYGNKAILCQDVLWKNSDNLTYLTRQNLPVVRYVKVDFIPESDIPVLYGNGCISIHTNEIVCDIDVFASIFFMLTRWEEYVEDKRDKYDRFIGKESIAFKYGFLNRPIVNEYVEMIWNMIRYLGYEGQRKESKFEIIPTHDIDRPFMKLRALRITKYIFDSIREKDYLSIPVYLRNYFVDPYDTYKFFIKMSESVGAISHFYFMSSDIRVDKNSDSPYMSNRYKEIVDYIKKCGHIIGFHPGYFSVESEYNWKSEKKKLCDFIGFNVDEGRQHYLRYRIPETFTFWENSNMTLDSSLSYHDVEGFRCGTGNTFSVFNFLDRKEYKLKERPLIIMDGTLVGYQNYSLNMISDILNYYIEICKKYNMPITLLFHNSIFIGYFGKQLMKLYSNIFKKIKDE